MNGDVITLGSKRGANPDASLIGGSKNLRTADENSDVQIQKV